MRTQPTLTLEGAQRIMAACKAILNANAWTGSVAIVDDAGSLLLFERDDGIPGVTAQVALGKAQLSVSLRRPSKAVRDMIKEQVGFIKLEGTPLQGGVPVMYQGACVGAVGVSGVNADCDERVAIAGANALP